MTSSEFLTKIKAEIERQQKENVNYDENGGFASYCDSSAWSALDSILTFVSGLEESEKPMQEGLEEEISRYLREECSNDDEPSISDTARHFAQWQKEQMMKEAVKADVMLTLHDKTGDISLHTGYLPKELGIKCDDKVRIIIVKED